MRRDVLLAVVPAGTLGAAYRIVFGGWMAERWDYLGHFAAGYGATLGLLVLVAMSVGVAVRGGSEFGYGVAVVCVPTVLIAVGLGAYCESTMFRLAKFDEVDFCNQSLGAVLAGMVMLAAWRRAPTRREAAAVGGVASGFLAAGFYYAFS